MNDGIITDAPGTSIRTAPPLAAPIALKLNPPPPIADVFDSIIRTAVANVLAREAPSSLIGHHRWCGTESDRLAGAVFCQQRLGELVEADRVILTSSTQSSLNMLMPGLIEPGGVLAVDALTYPPIKVFAARFGIRLAPVELDNEGMVPDALRAVCERERPKAMYPLSTLQNPTTGTMSLRRRREIVAIARKFGVSIIEDDIYSLIPQGAPPPLSALAPEISWYLLGLAKSVAPGMKVAYVVAPSRAAATAMFWPGVRATFWMTAPLSAAIATELVSSGSISKILNAVRKATLTRHDLVRRYFQDVNYRVGAGGLHVWIATPAAVSSADLAARIERNGVLVSTSDGFVIGDQESPRAIRIGLGNPNGDSTLEQALTVIAAEFTAFS